MMDSVIDTLRRVRWNVVGGILLVLLLIAVVFMGISPFSPGYTGEGDIVIKSWLEPSTTQFSDSSTLYVEVKNRGDSLRDVRLFTMVSGEALNFTTGKEANQTVSIGSGESRKIPFPLKVKAQYEGEYHVSIRASYNHQQIKDDVYLNVRK